MSIQTEITRLQGLRNTLRAALVALGLAQSAADLEDCVTAVEGIKNNGAVSGAITDAATPYNISCFLLDSSALRCYNQGGRGKAPGSPWGVWGGGFVRVSRPTFYSFMMRLTLSRSSSSVSHFSMSSRIAFSSASVTFISSIHLTPFCKRFCISALRA